MSFRTVPFRFSEINEEHTEKCSIGKRTIDPQYTHSLKIFNRKMTSLAHDADFVVNVCWI